MPFSIDFRRRRRPYKLLKHSRTTVRVRDPLIKTTRAYSDVTRSHTK